ncbi:MAG TPA: tetratricopeptide repeat protein [Gemmataceae bacterium]|nr:tetratricopeptide repeat protein [Gemmataceae bacterium]
MSSQVQPAPPKRRWGRWILLGAAVLLLAGGAAAAWQLLRPPSRPAPPDPPMPQGIQELDVQARIEAARQNVLRQPRDADAWGLLGMTLEAQVYEPEADRCFAEAARLDPSDPRWPYFRGLYAQKADPPQAVPFFRQALAAAGSSPPPVESAVRLRLAEALLEARELDEADKLFREELQRHPKEARPAYGLGLVGAARDDKNAVQEYLTVAAAAPETQKRATAQLAAFARAHHDDAAAAAYEKKWATLSNDPLAWPDPLVEQIAGLQVGHSSRSTEIQELEQQGRNKEAADIYLKQIAEDPNNAAACTGAGVNLFRLGEYDRAFNLLREGARRDPTGSDGHYRLAQALYTRADQQEHKSPLSDQEKKEVHDWLTEAAAEAEQAAARKPDHAQACLICGLSLQHLGKPAEAVRPLRQGVAARPGSFDLQQALGEALLDSGDKKEAEKYLENARKLDPNDKRLIDDLERLHR